MEHEGFKYEVRARGYPNKWEWAVYSKNGPARLHRTGEVVGGRQRAVEAAQSFIDSSIERRLRQNAG
jgi:hypothetical protein